MFHQGGDATARGSWGGGRFPVRKMDGDIYSALSGLVTRLVSKKLTESCLYIYYRGEGTRSCHILWELWRNQNMICKFCPFWPTGALLRLSKALLWFLWVGSSYDLKFLAFRLPNNIRHITHQIRLRWNSDFLRLSNLNDDNGRLLFASSFDSEA